MSGPHPNRREFTSYRTDYAWHRENRSIEGVIAGVRGIPLFSDESFKDPAAFYREHSLHSRLEQRITGNDDNLRQQLAEDQWYSVGKPYYKLYPEMLAALAKVNIDIDAGLLRLPFPAFRIDFPRRLYREHDDAPALRGLLVTGRRKGDPQIPSSQGTRFAPAGNRDPNYIAIDADFGDEVRNELPGVPLACKPFIIIETSEGATMRQRITEAFDWPDTEYRGDDAEGYMPGREFMTSWARIAVGIAFFAISNHQVVLSDVPAALLAKLERAKQSGKKKRIASARSRIKPYTKGFTVGKELSVPRQAAGSDDAEASGRELRFAHLRTGHMRWQAHGPGMKDRKLIFIPPTVVRKDLPLREATPRGVRYE